MLAHLSLLDIALEFISTNKAVRVVLEGIFDDVGALVTNFTHLRNSMSSVGCVSADQLNLVGQTLMEVMSTEGCILYVLELHI